MDMFTAVYEPLSPNFTSKYYVTPSKYLPILYIRLNNAQDKVMLGVLYNDNDRENSIDLIEVLTKRQPVQVPSTDNLFGVTSRPPGGRYNNIIKERSNRSVPIVSLQVICNQK